MRRFVAQRLSAGTSVRSLQSAPCRATVLRMNKLKKGETHLVLARRMQTTAPNLRAAVGVASTATSFPLTHDKIEKVEDTPYFLNNKFVNSTTSDFIELYDPATNNLVTRVPQNTDAELKAAVESAEKAFPAWRETSVLHRQQLMFKFVGLIRENWDRLAASITLEQGKTFADAKGDVLRGLQVAEAACAAPEMLKGEVLEVAKDMETRSYKEPLGVVAAICPFSKFQIQLAISVLCLCVSLDFPS